MNSKINGLKIYKFFLISAAATLTLLLCIKPCPMINSLQTDIPFIITLGILILISIPANKLVLKIPHCGEVRVSEIIYYASFILLNPLFLALLISASILYNYFLKIKIVIKKNLFFITANLIMVYVPSCIVYKYLSAASDNNFVFLQKNLPAFMLASVLCYVLKNTLDNLNRIFSKRVPLYYFWNFHGNKTLINLFIISPLGFFTGMLAKSNMAVFLLFMMPLLLIFKTLQNYTSLLIEIKEALKTISFLLDKKDHGFIFHSYSVAHMSKKIAQRLKLSEKNVEKIYHAALIHDLGKIAVSDQLLRKNSALTLAEYEKIKKHPLIGADLINSLSILQDEAIIIKHHHENYDGTGYPEGLDRNKIPLGSRILAVSEAYSTMTSLQPYKKKVSQAQALEEIKASKGFQFDPKIVETLVSVIKHEN